ncbi:MAG TPA: Hpt domain-containing protein, partial [Candidatus Acidoferrum sp.]|nr:Hpt domain-containing protein [Candidatus Acidoferrum sp.]
MTLEATPDDQGAIDGILREAHTMKGAAGMVGMMRVSRLAHRLEDLLVELRSGTRRSTPELTDSMLLVVDGLGRLISKPSSAEQDASDELAMERLLPTPGVDVAAVASPPAAAPTPGPIPLAPAAVLPPPEPAAIAPPPAPPAPPAVVAPPEPVADQPADSPASPAPSIERKKVETATLDV